MRSLEESEAEIERLRALLRSMEFLQVPGRIVCPCCDLLQARTDDVVRLHRSGRGHHEECRLAAVLADG